MRRSVSAPARTLVALAASLALGFGVGGLALATSADAASSYVATQAVNVRSGPGTSHRVIGVLALGKTINGSSTSSGWVKVSWQGGTGYVWGDYLKKTATATTSASPTPAPTATSPTPAPTATSPTPAPTTSPGSPASKVTTADLNVRTAPDATSAVVKVLRKGSTVHTTGSTSERWAQISIDGALYWVSSLYLADPGSATTLPAIAYTAKATAALAIRTSPSIGAASSGTVQAGGSVALTGTHSGSYSQIVHESAVRWVLTGYLTTSTAGAPTLPRATGTRYVKVDEVNIRATSASTGTVVGSAAYGTLLSTTGKTANNRTQVIYNGALRWAYSAYLSATRPSSSPTAPTPPSDDLGSTSLNKTNAYAHVVVKKIRAKFPTIKTIYGWRMSSAYSPDHPAGRALDIMIPSYKSAAGRALGDAIARYLQDNYKGLHVHYLIWRQRQWNVERNTNVTTGWRKMADRGSDTDNHLNHVHVTVYDVK